MLIIEPSNSSTFVSLNNEYTKKCQVLDIKLLKKAQ